VKAPLVIPFASIFACVALLLLNVSPLAAAERLRVIVETDAGGDPDDEQSLVRFLLYSNEWDIEAIIANRERARDGENKNTERTGLGIVRRLVNAYGECHANLVRHDPRFPKPEFLHARVLAGYGKSPAGVERIIEAVDAKDPRPIWFMNWGTDDGSAPSCLKVALDRILKERGAAGYARFKNKIRLSSADKFGDHTFKIPPAFPIWVDTFRPPANGTRWYHQFSAITAKAGGFNLRRDVLTGHGALGALYPTNTTHRQKEGDTMTFLYLVPTGMNNLEEPGWGSWAGRYGLQDDASGRPYYWANQMDSWNGTTHRDNTLLRWAADLQNDFRARLDWCVKRKSDANHRPTVIVHGKSGLDPVEITVRPREMIILSAEDSTDPDGNMMTFRWEIYPHTTNNIRIQNSEEKTVAVITPDALSETHVVVTVRDDGNPPLAAYRRVIIRVAQ
jgi:hypothetical protein